MIAVIFENWPREGEDEAYLAMAGTMRELAETVDGFISVERFRSLSDPEKLVSISFWRDEEALAEWRKLERHRGAQRMGRTRFFRDYRLRVAEVQRDYGLSDRDEAPADSRKVHG